MAILKKNDKEVGTIFFVSRTQRPYDDTYIIYEVSFNPDTHFTRDEMVEIIKANIGREWLKDEKSRRCILDSYYFIRKEINVYNFDFVICEPFND